MNKLFAIIVSLLFVGCSDDSGPKPGYSVWSVPDVYETCNDGECGPYPEGMRCGDGGHFPSDVRCVFVTEYGCQWIIFKCEDTGSP